MKIALLGYGKMNRLVAQLAQKAQHEIAFISHSSDNITDAKRLAEDLRGLDVAIDFSVAGAVAMNAEACARACVPLVEGTTGWHDEFERIKNLIAAHDGVMLHGANFSIGVNLFYAIVARAAEAFDDVNDYDVFITEAHHKHKRDAPSGTGLHLKRIVDVKMKRDVDVTSVRAGFIPGTHTVGFDSIADIVTLTHTARSREGFAEGALRAALWLHKEKNRRGILEFANVLNEILKED
ncbi:MAG: hypothetical protein MSG64_04990 [Pyrinomonadaceae bacterium MAG19_C2-C3]|nr:hypothetical protein [Pyrinomonadaceae bacterium MAG19_C2-C3]